LISENEINNAIDEYNQGKEEERQIDKTQIDEEFEDNEHCINISIDDVGVTEQKEEGRSKNSPPKESRHYVRNTVIHIHQQLSKYVLVGLGIKNMLRILIAFMLNNNIFENKTLIFFTDGADNIKNAIKDMFDWRTYRIILDWYHLEKKCKERLSMGMNGKEIRNEVLKCAERVRSRRREEFVAARSHDCFPFEALAARHTPRCSEGNAPAGLSG
jgi:hypothetical protein